MKLRIRGNSIRLRLGRSEVDRLLEFGHVREHVALGPLPAQRLEYAVEIATDEPDVCAHFDGTTLRVTVPLSSARHWARSDEVGIEARQDVGGGITGEKLHILIEKDFACLHREAGPAEDADAFVNPAAAGGQGANA